MGKALEMITGRVSAPSTTLTALTMSSGDSLTVRAAEAAKKTLLLQAWIDSQADGYLRIRSPKMHDNADGIQLRHNAASQEPLLPWGFPQRLYPQDVLAAHSSGSGTAGDLESTALLLYYEDLPGVDARLVSPDEVSKRMVHIMGSIQNLVAGTAGGYSGEQAVNADFDQFKADTTYALLGGFVDADLAAIGIRGVDTGNLRLGFPGYAIRPELTANWFVWLSQTYGIPLIPTFKANNKSGILVDCVNDENALSPNITLLFAELA